MEKNKVAVIGAGLMGNGIAQACATAGYDVVILIHSKLQSKNQKQQ